VLSREPAAITLRYLQTLIEIGVEKNTTIVFPLPMDLLSGLAARLGETGVSAAVEATTSTNAPAPGSPPTRNGRTPLIGSE
jgi:hypothetical protein